MTSDEKCWISVQRFLGREALCLDERKWDDWLALYREDAEYWLPAWDDDGELTVDPQREISLIYYPNRAGLEDRIYR
ncbi:MAG: benzene 1,2-dioxygenase, partial [Alphaproteobacteria bacterium HGW-Alphaproteobacteria-5]